MNLNDEQINNVKQMRKYLAKRISEYGNLLSGIIGFNEMWQEEHRATIKKVEKYLMKATPFLLLTDEELLNNYHDLGNLVEIILPLKWDNED